MDLAKVKSCSNPYSNCECIVKRTLTRTDIAAAIVKEIGLSQRESSELVEDILGHIVTALESGETVKIPHFGTFTAHETPGRIARNPKTKEPVWIDLRRIVKFKPSKRLKLRLIEKLNT